MFLLLNFDPILKRANFTLPLLVHMQDTGFHLENIRLVPGQARVTFYIRVNTAGMACRHYMHVSVFFFANFALTVSKHMLKHSKTIYSLKNLTKCSSTGYLITEVSLKCITIK